MNTTIAAAVGSLTTFLMHLKVSGIADLVPALNGLLAGLVSITAGCYCVTTTSAWIIGCVGGFIYYKTSSFLLRHKIDDPLDAFPVHGVCGLWGVLAVGTLFSSLYRHCHCH